MRKEVEIKVVQCLFLVKKEFDVVKLSLSVIKMVFDYDFFGESYILLCEEDIVEDDLGEKEDNVCVIEQFNFQDFDEIIG